MNTVTHKHHEMAHSFGVYEAEVLLLVPIRLEQAGAQDSVSTDARGKYNICSYESDK